MAYTKQIGFITFFIVVSLSVFAEDAPFIEIFPNSQLISEHLDAEAQSYELVKGPVKRVNTQLVPESSDVVFATKQQQTFELLGQRSAVRAYDFYRAQLLSKASIIFDCKGRACGASTYWANTYFKNSLLYGPEQFQSYILAKDENNTYIVVYIAQRATGRLMVQLELLSAESGVGGEKNVRKYDEIQASLVQGKFVFSMQAEADLLATIAKVIVRNRNETYLLVAHDYLRASEQVEAGITRTRGIAVGIREKLVAAGVPMARIQAYGAGPIAGMQAGPRVELLVLNK